MAEHKKPTKFSEVGTAVCVEFLGSERKCACGGELGQVEAMSGAHMCGFARNFFECTRGGNDAVVTS